jgi:hypothetical protein
MIDLKQNIWWMSATILANKSIALKDFKARLGRHGPSFSHWKYLV